MLLLLVSVAAAFDPAIPRAARFAATDPAAEPAAAFADHLLAPLGTVVRTQIDGGELYADRIERRVRFAGVQPILGVPCAGGAYALEVGPGIDSVTRRGGSTSAWGCPLAPDAAAAWGLPVGTIVELRVGDTTLDRIVLPPEATLVVDAQRIGALPCRGEIDLFGAVLGRCELASARRLNAVDLPAGAILTFLPEGRLHDATIPGRTVVAAGRTWGPEYTPCGALYLRFDEAGQMVPPQADPYGETCCI
ncbi:MAG: hypothetical protein V4850_08730 [Myxococcota bacterium]